MAHTTLPHLCSALKTHGLISRRPRAARVLPLSDMASHPNRGRPSGASNPAPEAIKSFRLSIGLSQTAFGRWCMLGAAHGAGLGGRRQAHASRFVGVGAHQGGNLPLELFDLGPVIVPDAPDFFPAPLVRGVVSLKRQRFGLAVLARFER